MFDEIIEALISLNILSHHGQIAYLVLRVYPFAGPFELLSNFVVSLYVHPWRKHIILK